MTDHSPMPMVRRNENVLVVVWYALLNSDQQIIKQLNWQVPKCITAGGAKRDLPSNESVFKSSMIDSLESK